MSDDVGVVDEIVLLLEFAGGDTGLTDHSLGLFDEVLGLVVIDLVGFAGMRNARVAHNSSTLFFRFGSYLCFLSLALL